MKATRKKKAKKGTRSGRKIQVNIHDTSLGPYVDMEPVQMTTDDEIEWHHVQGHHFTVTFAQVPPPFHGGPFDPANPNSGKPAVPPNPQKIYKYSVVTPAGPIDPGVIVH